MATMMYVFAYQSIKMYVAIKLMLPLLYDFYATIYVAWNQGNVLICVWLSLYKYSLLVHLLLHILCCLNFSRVCESFAYFKVF